MRRALYSLAILVTLTACGTASTATDAPPAHGPTTQSPTATTHASITVLTILRTDHGPLYTEGALAEVRLRDINGTVVRTKTITPGRSIRFTHLVPGTYQLEPALRPCDGNCGYLDGRTDSCRESIDLVDSIQVTVRFQVGAACRVLGGAG